MPVDPSAEWRDVSDPDERTFEVLSAPVPVELDVELSPLSPLPLLTHPLDLPRPRFGIAAAARACLMPR